MLVSCFDVDAHTFLFSVTRYTALVDCLLHDESGSSSKINAINYLSSLVQKVIVNSRKFALIYLCILFKAIMNWKPNLKSGDTIFSIFLSIYERFIYN
jgi:hypothetical protein